MVKENQEILDGRAINLFLPRVPNLAHSGSASASIDWTSTGRTCTKHSHAASEAETGNTLDITHQLHRGFWCSPSLLPGKQVVVLSSSMVMFFDDEVQL